MNTQIAYAPTDPEVDPTVEAPAVGTYVVRDGDVFQEDDLSRLLDTIAADIRRGDASANVRAAHTAWIEACR